MLLMGNVYAVLEAVEGGLFLCKSFGEDSAWSDVWCSCAGSGMGVQWCDCEW